MWRWHSIAAKKAAWDQAKAANYSKIGKIIQIAAKWWADVSMNPALELALQKAKYYNLPRDVIDKAIKKWSGQLKADDLHEVIYEWYWPGWAAVLVKTLTDNTNRSSSNIRIIFWKYGWNMGEPGSVSRQFKEKWVFEIDWMSEMVNDKWNMIEKVNPLNYDEAELELLDMDVEDVENEDGHLIVTVDKNNFTSVRDMLKEKNYHVIDWALRFLPENTISITGEDEKALESLMEALDEDEDVDSVYANNA